MDAIILEVTQPLVRRDAGIYDGHNVIDRFLNIPLIEMVALANSKTLLFKDTGYSVNDIIFDADMKELRVVVKRT